MWTDTQLRHMVCTVLLVLYICMHTFCKKSCMHNKFSIALGQGALIGICTHT